MPIIDTPAGTLEVTNAILSASEFRATQKISVSNSAPTKNFSVGDKFHVSTTDADAVNITGNLVAQTLKIGNLLVSPTFDLAAVSNVGNTTSNTLQFANATTSFVASSNVEIGGNITLTSNAQVKVGSNVLAEYTGPHGREPKEMPLKKYPEIAFEKGKFDRNDSTNTYVQAGYTVTASSDQSEYNLHAWRIFDGNTTSPGNGWASQDGTYYDGTSPANSYTGTTHQLGTGTAHGEWLKLELPHKIKVSRFTLYADSGSGYGINEAPKSYKIYGSVLGSSWTELKDVSGEVPSVNGNSHDITNTTAYKYLGIVVTQVNTNQDNIRIGELEYYGYEEPAPPGDLSLDTTLKSTFNSVRSNNYVMYFDGDGFIPGDNTSNNLVDNKSVIHHNATYDSTGKYWTLDGSTESNVTTGSLGFEGDVPHTVSTWINASNLEANAMTQQIFSIGSGYDKAFLKVDDTQIAANTWHNVTYAYQGEGGSKVTYVDGRKVAEAQVEDTFGKYPPFAMTDYKTGGYCVSATDESNDGTYNSYEAFDGVKTGGSTASDYQSTNISAWMPNYPVGGDFGTNGIATTQTQFNPGGGAALVNGPALIIQFPYKVIVSSYHVYARAANDIAYPYANKPKSGRIYGSDDGLTWTQIDSFGDWTTWVANTPQTEAITTPGAYNRYAMVVESMTYQSQTWVAIGEWELYGHKEGDLTRFPEPTRVLKYPHIAMTGPAQRGYVVSTDANNPDTTHAVWNIVDGEFNDRWQAPTVTYPTDGSDTTGGSTTTLADTTTKKGQYLQIESPHKLIVTKYKIFSNTGVAAYRPKKVILLGSNTGGTDWVSIDPAGEVLPTYSGSDPSYAATVSFSNTSAYKYHRLVIRALDSQGLPIVYEWELYGTEEDTGTPAIVGGPFAGKVANFRVYDQYLGDERIQEIYDAQKDEFGHKKSSMTLYKGRIGVGTTEPEGALTVIDEPHALAKFPARAISADDSYVEGDGQIKLSAADGSGYQAFDGLTSTSWTATPTRNTRLSEEVDFGAWLKIQTPESMSLKKAEFESNPHWNQVGGDILGPDSGGQFGRAVACNHDGTRVIVGGYTFNSEQGKVIVYDWNGSGWTMVGNVLTDAAASNTPKFGHSVAISGDGNIIAVAAPFEHAGSGLDDAGTVRVYYLSGAIWTILPDSGSLTETETGFVDVFVGATANDHLGYGGVKLSYDGYTILMAEHEDDTGFSNAGRVRVYTYANGEWSQKGSSLTGTAADERIGFSLDMSEDGNHIIFATDDGGASGTNPYVKVYEYGSDWTQKGATFTYTANDGRHAVAISNDGNVVAIGQNNADVADGARAENGGVVKVYNYEGSAWVLKGTINDPVEATDEEFGSFIALSGDGKRLIVSKPDEGSTNQGQLFTFEYTGSSWITRKPLASYGALGDSADGDARIGRGGNDSRSLAISRDGSVIIAGEQGFDPLSGSNGGRARVFSMPSNIKSIWGSNDDVNWTKIITAPTREEATSNVAGLAFGYDDRLEFKNLDNPNYYKYHAIVADAFTQLKDVKLFGVRNQGSSTLHDGALTLTKNLDVPRIGPPLDADDTPRRDRLVIELDTTKNIMENGVVRDTSGRGNNGIIYGNAKYDIREKALLFTGEGTDYIKIPTGFEGNQAFTISFWFKFDAIRSGRKDIFSILGTTGVTGSEAGLALFTVGTYLYTHQNDIYNTGYDLITDTNMHHIAITYSGGIPSTSTLSLYLDNLNVVRNLTSTNATVDVNFIKEKSFLRLSGIAGGTTTNFNGSISNLKLYDVALTEREINTLYTMGRCNEGHHITEFSKGRVNFEPDTLTISQIPIQPKMWADGGTITEVDGYRIHTFTTSGTFHLYTGGFVEFLIIGGGGGGAAAHGGGGGAGGYLESFRLLGKGSYGIIIGAGGAGGVSYNNGAMGNGSQIEELRDLSLASGQRPKVAQVGPGGGGGHGYGTFGQATVGSENGASGASAGGSGPYGAVIGVYDYDDDSTLTEYVANPKLPYIRYRTAGFETRYQGNNSGAPRPAGGAGHGAGGGGAGGNGFNASGTNGFNDGVSGGGGPGVWTKIRGFPEKLAGGGAGGRWGSSSAGPNGNGLGYNEAGGGSGGPGGSGVGGTGGANTGGGGGGGGDGNGSGGSGGSGICVIRYVL